MNDHEKLKSDIEALCEKFERDVLPSVKRLKLCSSRARLSDFVHRTEEQGSILLKLEVDVPLAAKEAKLKAFDLVKIWAFMAAGLTELLHARPKDPSMPATILKLQARLGHLQGYLDALCDMNAATSRRGAKGLRKRGQETKASVRDAALTLPTRLSKESAAAQIAPLVNKSTGTVRRLLMELFPGDSWEARGSANSMEVS